MDAKITLTQPVEAHGNPTRELVFRPPNGEDVRTSGVPFAIITLPDGTERSDYNTAAAATLISRLAGIPPSSVDRMNGADFIRAMNLVVGFFTNPGPTSSIDSTSSPGSSAATGSGN